DLENQAELEEKTRLINQVLELQHTLEDLSARVDAVKEENLKLKSENQVLGQYIENLMSASSVFQTTETKSKRKLNANDATGALYVEACSGMKRCQERSSSDVSGALRANRAKRNPRRTRIEFRWS
ncbi:hypothetical protein ILYODFUR_016539, partial [Ilyodon furcidens]